MNLTELQTQLKSIPAKGDMNLGARIASVLYREVISELNGFSNDWVSINQSREFERRRAGNSRLGSLLTTTQQEVENCETLAELAETLRLARICIANTNCNLAYADGKSLVSMVLELIDNANKGCDIVKTAIGTSDIKMNKQAGEFTDSGAANSAQQQSAGESPANSNVGTVFESQVAGEVDHPGDEQPTKPETKDASQNPFDKIHSETQRLQTKVWELSKAGRPNKYLLQLLESLHKASEAASRLKSEPKK
jgi:hypothetical protein